MSQKSYDGKNAVYLIPTPIGNMEDMTIRSLNILKMVDIIFSEDTRETNHLLHYFEIKKTLVASHKFNEEKNIEKFLAYLKEGKNIGIVTDRGTPIISDPGYILVKNAIENNFPVIALPGPTAFVPALIVSGLNPEPFYFYGFLNSKDVKKKRELEKLKNIKATLIFYEAPHRVENTLKFMLKILGNRSVSISREITKRYEEVYRGKIEDVIKEIEGAKGEFVIVVEGNHLKNNYENLTIVEHVNLYIKEGLEKKEAMKKVARDRNMGKSDIYKIYNDGGVK